MLRLSNGVSERVGVSVEAGDGSGQAAERMSGENLDRRGDIKQGGTGTLEGWGGEWEGGREGDTRTHARTHTQVKGRWKG